MFYFQPSDEETGSQGLALPTQPPPGPNGQVPLLPPAQTTPSTQSAPTWGTIPSSVTSLMGQTQQPAIPNSAQYSQTFQPQIGMTTFTLGNPLQALQNMQAAASNVQQLPQSQYSVSQPLLYATNTPQNLSQTVLPGIAQISTPLIRGTYPQQQQYATTQVPYPSPVKPQQQLYVPLGQTGAVQQSSMGYNTVVNPGQGVYTSLMPPSQVNTALPQKPPYNNTAYHQSTLTQGTTNQLIPSQLHQNTQYTNYATQNTPYAGVVSQGSTPTHQITQTPGYTPAVRSHTPTQGKSGSGGWSMR